MTQSRENDDIPGRIMKTDQCFKRLRVIDRGEFSSLNPDGGESQKRREGWSRALGICSGTTVPVWQRFRGPTHFDEP